MPAEGLIAMPACSKYNTLLRAGTERLYLRGRYGLRDVRRERINGLLHGREGHAGKTAKDNRLFVEAVRYHAGTPWRDLPERFGDFRIIRTRHTRWVNSGVWQRISEELAKDAETEYVLTLLPVRGRR